MKSLKFSLLFIITLAWSCCVYGQKSSLKPTKNQSAIPHFKIHIHYPEAEKGDQFGFNVSTHTPVSRLAGSSEFKQFVISQSAEGDYEIDLPLSPDQINKGIYVTAFDINNGTKPMVDSNSKSNFNLSAEILDNYFFQYGDNVVVDVKRKPGYQPGIAAMNNFVLKFQGNGHDKCQLRSDVDSMRYAQDFIYDYCTTDSSFVKKNHSVILAHKLLSYLNPYSKLMNYQAFEELKIHAFFSSAAAEALGTRMFVHERCKQSSKEFKAKFAHDLDISDTLRWSGFNRQSLYDSYDFWKSEVEKYYAVSDIQNHKWFADSLTSPISKITDSEIKERLYLLLATEFSGSFHNYTAYLQNASPYITTAKGKALLRELVRTTVGQKAFNFNLTDVNGSNIKLSDFKGKVVFVDFWYTGCENCRSYYDSVLSKVEEKYKSRPDIVFITISIDKNKDFWVKSLQGGHYTSKTAINLRTNGKGMDDDAIRFYDVQTFPRPLIIDRDQIIFKIDGSLREEYALINAINEASSL
ncbi:Thiol-disulfide isomerase or thioredoxin [Mucilaginibacter pineti]|uniref:Thiol-disulfide isomerase or thioredoxin n=1 Tax=Mucilaginibacter pineti TaxID=1391627 RepID=A0A1G7JNW1_9SPHI|nr:TlpA disulfide reductase family protein [Mucilaginibacter pineti]SDF26627.1 Thiol-disulfide isomerase or thioredoxin [Mucilaginibacter pineti]